MPSLPNIHGGGDSTVVLPNFKDLVVKEATIQDIFCNDIIEGTYNIKNDIAQFDSRISLEEDKNANHSRLLTVDSFNDSIQSDGYEFTLPQTSSFTTGSITTTAGLNATTINNPVVTVSGSNVGINNAAPSYNLQLQAGALTRVAGDLRVNGIVRGPLWTKLLASGPEVLTSSVGTSKLLSTTIGSYTYYPRKIVVVLRNISKTNTLTNGPMVTVTLGTAIAPFTGGYNHYCRGVAWNGTNTYQSLTWAYSASIVMDGPYYTRSQVIKDSVLTLYHMGNNVWTYNGTYSAQDGTQYGAGTMAGYIECPSQALMVSVKLARPSNNGGSDTVFTVDTTARMSGNVQIFLE